MWRNSYKKDPFVNMTVTEYGWDLLNGVLKFKWFEGDQFPKTFDDILSDVSSDAEYIGKNL